MWRPDRAMITLPRRFERKLTVFPNDGGPAPGRGDLDDQNFNLNMNAVTFRCQMLVSYWIEMLDLFDLYLEAFPRGGDTGRHECNAQDAVSGADDSFIDPDHETWIYDKMHLERNGQTRREQDTKSIFRGSALFRSSVEDVSPAVVAGVSSRRRQSRVAAAAVGANGNRLMLNTEKVGKQIEGLKDAVVGGAQQMGTSRFWSSAAAAAGGSAPWNARKMKPILRPV